MEKNICPECGEIPLTSGECACTLPSDDSFKW